MTADSFVASFPHSFISFVFFFLMFCLVDMSLLMPSSVWVSFVGKTSVNNALMQTCCTQCGCMGHEQLKC